MKKTGFVSTALIYTFFILFLLLMIFLLRMYSRNRLLNEQYATDIKAGFLELSGADINMFFFVNGKIVEKVDSVGYSLESRSYCKNGATIEENEEGKIRIKSKGKDDCFLYFKEVEPDISFDIIKKVGNNEETVNRIPDNTSFSSTDSYCENSGTVSYADGHIIVTSNGPDHCYAVFIGD